MKRIEMIGTPLDHVRSPGILNPMFRAAGDDVEVVTRGMGPGDLAAYVEKTRGSGAVIGLIVTTPLKQAITAHLDRKTGLVAFLGASNCVRCDGAAWIGANFDGHGFVAALAEVASDLSGRHVLIVGCGGAGSAIAASLVQAADIGLSIFDVDQAKAADFAKRLASFAPSSTATAIAAPVGAFDIVINASPAGMNRGDAAPIPEETVAAAAIVADIVTVAETRLKHRAAALGKPIVTGEAMVLGQAALLRRFFLSDAGSERDVLDA
jgi:shikimate dehydrogenase